VLVLLAFWRLYRQFHFWAGHQLTLRHRSSEHFRDTGRSVAGLPVTIEQADAERSIFIGLCVFIGQTAASGLFVFVARVIDAGPMAGVGRAIHRWRYILHPALACM